MRKNKIKRYRYYLGDICLYVDVSMYCNRNKRKVPVESAVVLL